MRRFSHPDKHRAKTDKERDYYTCGIPSQFWPDNKRKPDFLLVHDDEEDIHIEPGVQKRFYNSILTEDGYFDDPYCYIISSTKDNHLALTLGYEILKVARSKGHRIQVTDAHVVPYYDLSEDRDETVHLIHNVFSDSTADVITATRRAMSVFSGIFTVIVTADDPIKLKTRLKNLEPDGYFYTNSTKVLQR